MSLAFIIIAVIVVVIIVWLISISNKINRLIVKIKEADSGIDVALTKRYDVLTKMIDVVKGYAKHEEETIFKTIEMRKGMSLSEKETAVKDMAAPPHRQAGASCLSGRGAGAAGE